MKVSREQIIIKALGYFASQDYESVSLNGIADALNITKGAIYHYFGSKDELFLEAFLYMMDKMDTAFDNEKQQEQAGSGLEGILRPMFDLEKLSTSYAAGIVGFDIMRDYKAVVYLMFTALQKYPQVEARLRKIYKRFVITLKAVLMDAAEKGQIRDDIDFDAFSFMICAYIEGGLLLGAMDFPSATGFAGDGVFDMLWSFIKKN